VKVGVVQLNRVEIMALGDEEILPAIIIIVEKADAPAGMLHSGARQAGTEAGIRKRGVAIVLVESVVLVGQIGDQQVRPAVVIVIGEIDAHAGIRASVAIDSHLR